MSSAAATDPSVDVNPSRKRVHPTSQRRQNKPLMEKRRRARINDCLLQLKVLLMKDMSVESSRPSKLEKADILEMTVDYIKKMANRKQPADLPSASLCTIKPDQLSPQPPLAPPLPPSLPTATTTTITTTTSAATSPASPSAPSSSPSSLSSSSSGKAPFLNGFSRCLQEVDTFLGQQLHLHTEVRRQLLAHCKAQVSLSASHDLPLPSKQASQASSDHHSPVVGASLPLPSISSSSPHPPSSKVDLDFCVCNEGTSPAVLSDVKIVGSTNDKAKVYGSPIDEVKVKITGSPIDEFKVKGSRRSPSQEKELEASAFRTFDVTCDDDYDDDAYDDVKAEGKSSSVMAVVSSHPASSYIVSSSSSSSSSSSLLSTSSSSFEAARAPTTERATPNTATTTTTTTTAFVTPFQHSSSSPSSLPTISLTPTTTPQTTTTITTATFPATTTTNTSITCNNSSTNNNDNNVLNCTAGPLKMIVGGNVFLVVDQWQTFNWAPSNVDSSGCLQRGLPATVVGLPKNGGEQQQSCVQSNLLYSAPSPSPLQLVPTANGCLGQTVSSFSPLQSFVTVGLQSSPNQQALLVPSQEVDSIDFVEQNTHGTSLRAQSWNEFEWSHPDALREQQSLPEVSNEDSDVNNNYVRFRRHQGESAVWRPW